MKKTIFFTVVATCFLWIGCRQNNKNVVGRPQQYTEREIEAEGAKLNKWVDARYDEYLGLHPQAATFLGDKRGYDKWNHISEATMLAERDNYIKQAAWLKDSVDAKALDVQEQITYKLYQQQVNDAIERYDYRNNPYLVNQMFGMQSDIPAFLINMHHIDDPIEAAAYIARVSAMGKLFDDLIVRLKTSAKAGVVPPRFVLAKVLDASKNISKGFPITADKAAMNEVFADFSQKVLLCKKVPPPAKAALGVTMTAAMTKDFGPAYQRLITYLEKELLPKSTNDAGVWKFKDGAKYYDFCLRTETTTSMNAEAVHQLGLKEVARIQGEMNDIMKKVDFKGDIQAFFQFMRTDSSFYYPETAIGKTAYITKSNQIIDSMTAALPKIFNTFPKAKLLVKQVEPFREKTAGSAFYDAPSPDGKRKGTYYLNTYDMKSQSKYEMEALAYHEGIPGHHMQLAIAQEMTTLPKFRRFGDGFTAYVEGWGLYSEWIPKAMGFYKDPYSDFGRLSMELFRACRLVVDTGLHGTKKWTRAQAIKYYKDNTPTNDSEIQGMVDRHCVMPGQATAYKIGMIKIQDLRKKAETELKDKFDVREFHDAVITNGALSLDVLEEVVNRYIAQAKLPKPKPWYQFW